MKNLAKLRKLFGLSQQKFGDEIGLARNTICQYESGNRVPDVDTLIKIAEFFGVSVDYVLGLDCTESSYEIFIDICIKENRTTQSVAEEFGITGNQLLNWKQGNPPEDRILWAIANKFHYYSENPFSKAKEKAVPMERPENKLAQHYVDNYMDLLQDSNFIDITKICAAGNSEIRAFFLGMIVQAATRFGLDANKILGY